MVTSEWNVGWRDPGPFSPASLTSGAWALHCLQREKVGGLENSLQHIPQGRAGQRRIGGLWEEPSSPQEGSLHRPAEKREEVAGLTDEPLYVLVLMPGALANIVRLFV